MKIADITSKLIYKEGIWYSENCQDISYPPDANNACLNIEQNSFWFNHRNNVIVQTVNAFVKNEKVLADVGGGNGAVAAHLSRNGYEILLVEPGFAGIINAKNRGINHLVNSTLQDAGFKNNSLPNVGLFDVVEHIKNDREFLASIKHYLKEDGRIFITVPAFSFLWSQNDEKGGHFKRYSIRSFTTMANQSGFEVEYATYFFSILPVSIFLFRSLPYRLGFRFKNIYQKSSEEHSKRNSKTLDSIWKYELTKIKNRKRLPFGGSCLFVLKKNE